MTDDDLRDRMRRADPAASVRPLPEDEVRRLVAGAALDGPVAPRFSTRKLPVLVGAAAAIAVVAGVFVLNSGGQQQAPRPDVALPTSTQPGLENGSGLPDNSGGRPTTSVAPPTGTTTVPAPPVTTTSEGRKTTVVVLTDGPVDPDVRCRKPEAAVLRERAQMAFEATVLKLEGNVVTLRVDRAWAGEADLVEVRNTTNSPMLLGFEPEVGRKYLVAASDLQVMGCGYSGIDEPELRAVYDEAFPKR
ncbi:hypothetical protein GCM10011609_83540 [Lentzea pudingi]|uniref:Uncharacterized protein n=1 Tax=Lentzea pudingi TaxID=1789439 RepID=A0ABQ2IUH3_9PSEU|nr:hypothetical protein [Lentzea pudingi]GGN27905.1 hypothetical protein GCM10011609_83540 [Lentzea pudingi]